MLGVMDSEFLVRQTGKLASLSRSCQSIEGTFSASGILVTLCHPTSTVGKMLAIGGGHVGRTVSVTVQR